MKNILTFVIPVRHPENSSDWPTLKKNLAQTLLSLSAQTHPGWRAILVANEGSDLPDLPPGVEVKFVTYPPNPLRTTRGLDTEEGRQVLLFDKGRRLLTGMLHAGEMGYVMTVDEDDFVSRRLTQFVAEHFGENGWYVRDGFIWGDGGPLLYRYDDFSMFCGTSHLIRSDLYDLPSDVETADPDFIRNLLGSHRYIREHLRQKGAPIAALPFPGAMYRIGHAGSYSKTPGILSKFFCEKGLVRHPRELIRRVLRLRWMTRADRAEFQGAGKPL